MVFNSTARMDGSVAFQKKICRTKMLGFLALQPYRLVVMEACAGAHHRGRALHRFGHEMKLMPQVYVKHFVKYPSNLRLSPFTAMNLMLGREAASQIASTSLYR